MQTYSLLLTVKHTPLKESLVITSDWERPLAGPKSQWWRDVVLLLLSLSVKFQLHSDLQA